MTLETLSSNELLNLVMYDSFVTTSSVENSFSSQEQASSTVLNCFPVALTPPPQCSPSTVAETVVRRPNLAVQGRKKRRRKPSVCKNKEEAETQRMAHIAVERNRRKQMNEQLTVLRSLMPESYVQRGDQASIVGGAIEFVKELEHLQQTLEAEKLRVLQQVRPAAANEETSNTNPNLPFFMHHQTTLCHIPDKYTSKTKATSADIEVTLIETHANLRIVSRKGPSKLSKLVVGFQSLYLSILHLNVTTMDPLVLYSISAKVEEGCQLSTVDDIARAVHHMIEIIEEDATAVC
ncbi:Transcription factor bHLH96 [Hibiscus syriacus]|uniref:Transcription factor bHLH96 n=1 Tax=Hibiscus syriacus TaxID=106335 RepID=A0A6A2XP97_HIBSY|nr:transcription factor bHLH71-like [Hibiscus syriacus]XP_039036373.1 transcription factor bHLH71-like [Hibiscus syriacus]KAE8671700.1 Transcription factor bHLH96 [Hibiscus syriacus]